MEDEKIYQKYDQTVAKSLEYISDLITKNQSINITNLEPSLPHYKYIIHMLYMHQSLYQSRFRFEGGLIKLLKIKKECRDLRVKPMWFKKNNYNWDIREDYISLGQQSLLTSIYYAYYAKNRLKKENEEDED